MTVTASNEAVRRPITLTSPMVNGDDCRVLKRALNRHTKHWQLPYRKLDDHGFATEATFKTAAIIAFCLGLSEGQIADIKRGVITEHAQRLIRHAGLKTELRDKSHYRRSRRRRVRVRKLRATKSARIQKTIRAAGAHVGETEQPAGSNKGPGIISLCQKNILGYDGIYWCGCYTGDLTRRVGKVTGINSRVAYTPATLEDGRAGANGFIASITDPKDFKLGDHLLFDFGSSDPVQHTGFFLRHEVQNGVAGVVAREGNTSSGSSGSQDNGGGVFDRFRPYYQIVAASRPNW